MQKKMFVMAVLVMVIGVSASGSAQLSQSTWNAKIPYNFHVENQSMPAGEYTVQWVAGRLRLATVDGKHSISLLTFPRDGRMTQETSRLKFKNYGGEHFMTEIYFAGQEQSRELLKSKLEKQLSRKILPTTELVARK